MTSLICFFSHREREKIEKKKKKNLKCFVSHNYSSIMWSKHRIRGHFVVGADSL